MSHVLDTDSGAQSTTITKKQFLISNSIVPEHLTANSTVRGRGAGGMGTESNRELQYIILSITTVVKYRVLRGNIKGVSNLSLEGGSGKAS